MNKTALIAALLTIATIAGVAYLHQKGATNTFLAQDKPWNTKETYDKFTAWQKKYGKDHSHKDVDISFYKFHTFADNLKIVNEHNAKFNNGEETFALEMNEFADLTNEEFVEMQKLGYTYSDITVGSYFDPSKLLGYEEPTSVDWRTQKAVTPVKNQGSCGSCWAFSTTGSLEGQNAIHNGELTSFSEQDLVDCSTSYGNQGCNGGLMDNGFKYVKAHGIAKEADYKYKGVGGTCNSSVARDFKISSFQDITPKSSKAFKAAVANGPVSVAIQANGIFFQLYSHGVFSGRFCGTQLDHGVLAVGYGTDSGKDFYLVKNSWGASWGMKGYIEMENKGDGNGVCGIQLQASQPRI